MIGILVNLMFVPTFIPFDFTFFVILTVLFILIDNFVSTRPILIKKRRAYIAWYTLAILLIASYWWTRAPIYGFRKLYLFFPLILTAVLWGKEWVKNFKTYRIITTITYIIILITFYLSGGLNDLKRELVSTYFRLKVGDGANPIPVATLFGYGIILTSSHLFAKNNQQQFKFFQPTKKVLLALIITISLIMIFLTGSKGPMLALIGSFSLYFFLRNVNPKKIILIGSSVLICLLLFISIDFKPIVMGIFPKDLHYFINNRFFDNTAEGSVSTRLALIQLAQKSFADRNILAMIFGEGIGDFGYVYFNGIDNRYYPHNIFLELLHEVGLLGFLLFSYMMYHIVNFNIKYKGNSVELKWLFIFFYFFFIRSLTTGDIPHNFGVFIHFLLILKFEDLLIAAKLTTPQK